MVDIPIDKVDLIGLIKDDSNFKLPPEAWTDLFNCRFADGKVRRLLGRSATFGTPTIAPVFVMPVTSGSAYFWMYPSLTKVHVWDGAAHSDITRAAGGNYAATNVYDWNGTNLQGIPILNNGVDIPQFWATVSAGTDLANLTNWDSAVRTKVVRALGNFLVAFNLTISGVNKPHRVRWSHSAEPGTLPTSYDVLDDTKDTGEVDLNDVESGIILDALPLKGRMFIYKENATWVMRYIGGDFIFDFDPFLETSGILAPRCVGITADGQYHFVVTQDNIIVHDGVKAIPLLNRRMRRNLFSRIDATNYRTSYVYTDPQFNEVHFCYPESGSAVPNRELIWNYENGLPGRLSEGDESLTYATSGTVEVASQETWNSAVGTWDADTENWGQLLRRQVIGLKNTTSKFYLMNDGLTRDGTPFIARAQRTALALSQTKDGEIVNDFTQFKMAHRLWTRAEGGPINVRIGAQAMVNSGVSWSTPQSFDPASEMYEDFDPVQGRALAVEFSTTDSVDWALDGYTLEVSPLGRFG